MSKYKSRLCNHHYYILQYSIVEIYFTTSSLQLSNMELDKSGLLYIGGLGMFDMNFIQWSVWAGRLLPTPLGSRLCMDVKKTLK